MRVWPRRSETAGSDSEGKYALRTRVEGFVHCKGGGAEGIAEYDIPSGYPILNEFFACCSLEFIGREHERLKAEAPQLEAIMINPIRASIRIVIFGW